MSDDPKGSELRPGYDQNLDLEKRVRELVERMGARKVPVPKVFFDHPDNKALWESHGLTCTLVDDGDGVYMEVRREKGKREEGEIP